MVCNPVYFPCAKDELDFFKWLLFIQNGILLLCVWCLGCKTLYISQHINDVIVMSKLQQKSSQRRFDVTVALLLHYVSAGDGTLNHNIIMYNSMWNYLIIVYIYHYHTYIMQISTCVINNMPEPGRNLSADACMGRTQLSPCILSVPGHSMPTGMPCQHDIIFMLSHLYPDFLWKYT